MGTDGSLLSWREYATIMTLKRTGKLRMSIRDNTELEFYCRRIVAIVNSNVVVLGSARYGYCSLFFIFCIKISLKFVPKVPIDNNSALIEIMAWRLINDKPLS